MGIHKTIYFAILHNFVVRPILFHNTVNKTFCGFLSWLFIFMIQIDDEKLYNRYLAGTFLISGLNVIITEEDTLKIRDL